MNREVGRATDSLLGDGRIRRANPGRATELYETVHPPSSPPKGIAGYSSAIRAVRIKRAMTRRIRAHKRRKRAEEAT